jgi:hypothetical protein
MGTHPAGAASIATSGMLEPEPASAGGGADWQAARAVRERLKTKERIVVNLANEG